MAGDTQEAGFIDAPNHCDVALAAEFDLARNLREVPAISAANSVAIGVFVNGKLVDTGINDGHLHIGVLVQVVDMFQSTVIRRNQQIVAGRRVPYHIGALL